MLCLTLTNLLLGQYTRCLQDSTLKPIQWPSHACRSSLELVGLCTQTVSPKCFSTDKLGGDPYSTCQGVLPPRARIEVRFFSHVDCLNASPHRLCRRPAMCSRARTFSTRVWLRCSAMLLNCGTLWTVCQRAVPASARCLLKASLRYSPLQIGAQDFYGTTVVLGHAHASNWW